MKKYTYWIILFSLFWFDTLQAAPLPPLKIATDVYSPPFIARGANKQIFGFDIDMMEHLCKILGRTCQYNLMPFQGILQSVQDHTNDLGIGGITITLERSKSVSFSIPYLLSYAQYLGLKTQNTQLFSNQALNGKKIGIEAGSVFSDVIHELNMPSIKIVEYKTISSVIEALQSNKIDVALMDSVTAKYWQSQSNAMLVTLGPPFLYGFGFGIVVGKNNPELLEDINTALLEYQNNGHFQKAYNEYIAQF